MVQGIQKVPKGPRYLKGTYWSRLLGMGDTHTDTQTETHINMMTWPGLGAGPSENLTGYVLNMTRLVLNMILFS